jgi:hypothetical protein
MTRTRVALRVILFAIVALDVVLVAGRWAAGHELYGVLSPFSRTRGQIPLPVGYLSDGARYRPPQTFKCALLEYTSTECEYCRAGAPAAAKLEHEAGARGCTTLVISPAPNELPARMQPGQVALAYVAPQWLSLAPHLQLEPTTVLLAPGGKIAWYRTGELTARSVVQALARLRSALPAD